ncbi:thiol peroxidase [Bellilinea sp.]|uniref:thiol peroxidase n=1 Tax=Bellilinea sp. TaxID=2838785 RepID=UPI002ADE2604|nr:thiol peroxidase [Bellilinea sp.]
MIFPERNGVITFAGRDVTVVGPDLKVGEIAPEFTVQAQDWSTVSALSATEGKVRIIASVPSLETSVCDRETRQFNQDAANLSKDISILVISTDLPYTQKRWCGAAGIDQVMVLSDHMDVDFGKKYGVLIKEIRILRRAVFVVDRNNRITYAAYMPTIGAEPDYDAVIEAAKQAL